MPSESLDLLNTRLEDIDQIKAAHDAAAGGRRVGRRWNTESLNRAAIVLLASHFEGFLEDLFQECVTAWEAGAIASGRVPRPFVIGSIAPEVHTLARSKDSSERNKALEKLLAKASTFVDAQRPIGAGQLDAKPIVREMGNPTPEHIELFFAHVGVDRVLDGVGWRHASNETVRRNLRELVDLRNRIAHGEPEVRVVWASVDRYRRYVVGAAQKLDEKLRNHLSVQMGRPSWPQ